MHQTKIKSNETAKGHKAGTVAPIESYSPERILELASGVSQQVLEWVAEHARSGVSAESVHAGLVRVGWHPEVAKAVIGMGISKACPGFTRNPYVSQFHQFVTPEPLLESGSPFVHAGDRDVEVVATSLVPRIVVFDGLMSGEECQELIETATPLMTRSGVIEAGTGSTVVDEVRTSTGAFLPFGGTELMRKIESRISCLLNWPAENCEDCQILNYQVGAEYKAHQDYFDPTDPGTPKSLGLAGQRVATLLMYLNTPKRGGSTFFPDAGIEVRAKLGRAVLFTYDQPSAAKKALHTGAPVLEGEKWVATKWFRQKSFVPKGVPLPG